MPDPQKSPIDPGTVFVRNPSGAVHDVDQSHAGVAAAARGRDGWRFATAAEVKTYAKTHSLEDPDQASLDKRAAALRKAAADEDAKAAGALPPAPSAEEAGLEPVEENQPAKKTAIK